MAGGCTPTGVCGHVAPFLPASVALGRTTLSFGDGTAWMAACDRRFHVSRAEPDEGSPEGRALLLIECPSLLGSVSDGSRCKELWCLLRFFNVPFAVGQPE